MAVGRVVRFDEMRGYGFASTDQTGDDVFIHINDFTFEKRQLSIGTRVEFDVEEGERGLKASSIRLASEQAESSTAGHAEQHPVPVSNEDDPECDVLTAAELSSELTEALLNALPELTARQILAIRGCVATMAVSHGWIE